MNICEATECRRAIRCAVLCKFHLRELLRSKEKCASFCVVDCVQILKELYSAYWANPKDKVLYNLLSKYRDKLPHRAPQREKLWKQALEDGKENPWLRNLIYGENPFLKLLKKEPSSFEGKYFPVPLFYGDLNA